MRLACALGRHLEIWSSTKKLVLGDAPPLVASAPSPVHHPEPASSYSEDTMPAQVCRSDRMRVVESMNGDGAYMLL
jgi:hypothetical protein